MKIKSLRHKNISCVISVASGSFKSLSLYLHLSSWAKSYKAIELHNKLSIPINISILYKLFGYGRKVNMLILRLHNWYQSLKNKQLSLRISTSTHLLMGGNSRWMLLQQYQLRLHLRFCSRSKNLETKGKCSSELISLGCSTVNSVSAQTLNMWKG